MHEPGPYWEQVNRVPRFSPSSLEHSSIPSDPGVYIWFRDGEPVYLGEAKGAQGLRGRLRAHRSTGIDLSRSTLRASVASMQLGIDRAVARRRPSVMTGSQMDVVNDWLANCELGWIVCETADEAHALESSLLAEWMPPLNIKS